MLVIRSSLLLSGQEMRIRCGSCEGRRPRVLQAHLDETLTQVGLTEMGISNV